MAAPKKETAEETGALLVNAYVDAGHADYVAKLDPIDAPQPQWLRLTVPDYPHVAHLLLWPDGKVTWK